MDSVIDFKALRATGCISCGDWQPLKLEDWLLQWLRQHFGSAANITFTDLKSKIWRPDDTTGIYIESVGRWRPQLTEKRPGIVIKDHGLQAMQLGIGNLLMGTSGARDVYSLLVTGSHSLFCIGGEYGEAKLLAAEVFREVMKFGILHVLKLGFQRLTPPQMGPVAKLEEARENFAAPISLGYSFWETWEIKPQDTAVARFNDLTITPTNP